MSNIKIKTEGFKELQERIRKVVDKIDVKTPIRAAAGIVIRKTRSNLPEGAKSLSEAVQFSYNNAKAEGKVHIMGNRIQNGWVLRFFEKGTELRSTKTGANRGRMKSYWFFKKSINESKDQAIETYKKSFMQQLTNLWNE